VGRKQVAKLARKGPARPERHVIALFSEGEVTEPEYLRALARLPEVRERTKLSLRIDLVGAVPLTLVEAAVAEKSSDTANEYWCVFDVEWPRHHPNLQQALDLAARHGIEIAMSNPSFELWLILHHQNQTAFLDNDGARRLRRELDGSADKHLDPKQYLPHRAAAATRATELGLYHEKNGSSFPQNNPITTVHRLVASVENARQA
jgi:hypothetical protein